MTITMKIVNLLDRLNVQKFFVEENNRVHLKLGEFNTVRLEEAIDKLLPPKGKAYQANKFEQDCIRELEF